MKLIKLLFAICSVTPVVASIAGGPSWKKKNVAFVASSTTSNNIPHDCKDDNLRLIDPDSKSKTTALASRGGFLSRPTTKIASLRRFGGTLLESAMYGFLFATLAVLSAGWIERIFPRYNPIKNYTAIGLFLQISCQAGVNCALAQAARELIQRLPLPDFDGSDKALPASGGGVVFGFFMFSRQSNWKSKVAALDAMLDKTWLFP